MIMFKVCKFRRCLQCCSLRWKKLWTYETYFKIYSKKSWPPPTPLRGGGSTSSTQLYRRSVNEVDPPSERRGFIYKPTWGYLKISNGNVRWTPPFQMGGVYFIHWPPVKWSWKILNTTITNILANTQFSSLVVSLAWRRSLPFFPLQNPNCESIHNPICKDPSVWSPNFKAPFHVAFMQF